jgi:predicted small secreted protein
MKIKEFIVGIIIGVAIGFVIARFCSNRYSVIRLDDNIAVRVDNITGKAWRALPFAGSSADRGWVEIPEHSN